MDQKNTKDIVLYFNSEKKYNWPEGFADIKITYDQYRYLMFNYVYDLYETEDATEKERIQAALDKELTEMGATYEDISKATRAIWYM